MPKHEPNPATGITPELAAELDRAAAAMESGDPDGIVSWDESGETWSNIHPSDVGGGSQALSKTSSNSQVAFSSLVENSSSSSRTSKVPRRGSSIMGFQK